MQILDHEQQGVAARRTHEELVQRGMHLHTRSLGINDFGSAWKASREVGTDSGEGVAQVAEFSTELAVRQASNDLRDHGVEGLIRALRSVGATSQHHLAATLVHLDGDGSGESRLADPGLAMDDGDRCPISCPAGQ